LMLIGRKAIVAGWSWHIAKCELCVEVIIIECCSVGDFCFNGRSQRGATKFK